MVIFCPENARVCLCYTLFPTLAACGARQEEVTCALFISLHFTPRSSFSYNHCTLPPMCPIHTTPKELVHTKFYAAKNWARTVFIFSPVKRFDRRQKLGEERIGTSDLKMSNKVYRSDASLTIGSDLTFLLPEVGHRVGMKFGKMVFLVSFQLCHRPLCVLRIMPRLLSASICLFTGGTI